MPEVSLHTEVKGQFGHGTGRAMGKALKKFPRSVLRQDTKSCRGDHRHITLQAAKINGLQRFFTLMLLSAVVVTLLGILIALLLAFLTPVHRDHLQG